MDGMMTHSSHPDGIDQTELAKVPTRCLPPLQWFAVI